ncbi:flagellar hook assembly protein FlgD [Rhizobium sp. CFBP 8762]|uniref:flagellar hook assembly protein FlgD n=1 Tax=Rhizobium sp. CFBP 8762 TaxID=2775279 RepID=UPI0017867A69|nr:flagellar hook assembly protein FlgD [Rhizobium sp. CFBP 8762]MBD8553445.1 flagellar hook assembly protein FlgD [Rhizobium sp. CFBP 8762]
MAVDAAAATTAVTQTAGTVAPTASTTAAKSATLNYESFLQLLVAQMKNQDPTAPMDAAQQLAQLASFSQVEQTIKTNKNLELQVEQTIKTNTNLELLLSRNAISEASAMIGKQVSSADGAVTGIVKEVKLYSDGIIAVLDTGNELLVGPGTKVRSPS